MILSWILIIGIPALAIVISIICACFERDVSNIFFGIVIAILLFFVGVFMGALICMGGGEVIFDNKGAEVEAIKTETIKLYPIENEDSYFTFDYFGNNEKYYYCIQDDSHLSIKNIKDTTNVHIVFDNNATPILTIKENQFKNVFLRFCFIAPTEYTFTVPKQDVLVTNVTMNID